MLTIELFEKLPSNQSFQSGITEVDGKMIQYSMRKFNAKSDGKDYWSVSAFDGIGVIYQTDYIEKFGHNLSLKEILDIIDFDEHVMALYFYK